MPIPAEKAHQVGAAYHPQEPGPAQQIRANPLERTRQRQARSGSSEQDNSANPWCTDCSAPATTCSSTRRDDVRTRLREHRTTLADSVADLAHRSDILISPLVAAD